MSKKHSFSSLFSCWHVYLGFEISSVEANLVYFSIFSIVSVFLAFKTYLILKVFVIVNVQSAAVRLSRPYREIPDRKRSNLIG